MADVELFKLLVQQAGSFGLVAVFFYWILFKASPRVLESNEAVAARHAETIRSMAADHKAAMVAIAESHQTTVATLSKDFRESLADVTRECREERAQMQERFDQIAAKDRDLRHDMADKFTAAVNHLATSQMRPLT